MRRSEAHGRWTAEGRPFCLYAVLGSTRRRRGRVGRVNRVLDSVRIGPPE